MFTGRTRIDMYLARPPANFYVTFSLLFLLHALPTRKLYPPFRRSQLFRFVELLYRGHAARGRTYRERAGDLCKPRRVVSPPWSCAAPRVPTVRWSFSHRTPICFPRRCLKLCRGLRTNRERNGMHQLDYRTREGDTTLTAFYSIHSKVV